MKKVVFVLALIALALPVFAQEFPDVPPDHWAYQAVQELVNGGIIQGYPDGTYGGKRAMTRYEFAEAVAKAIPAIEEKLQGKVGPAGPAGAPGAAGPAGSPGVTPEQLQAMQKLIDEFRDELAALGVDVEALRRDVAALCERVAALENEVARVKITGAANLLARGEIQNGDNTVLDRDNRQLASINSTVPDRDNPLANSAFFHDFDLNVKGRVGENASFNSTIVLGSYLNYVLHRGGELDDENDLTDFTLWNLNFNGAVKLPLLGMTHLVVGRFPFQLTPFTLKFVNPDSYNFNEKLAAGDYPLDGASALFNWSKASLSLFAAKAGTLTPWGFSDFNDNLTAANWLMDSDTDGLYMPQLAGARLIVGTGMGGNLGLTWYQAGMEPTVGRANVFGADLNIMPGQVGFAAEYATIQANDQFKAFNSKIADNTNALKAKLSYAPAKLGLGIGYIDVGSGFRTPGNWMRLGRAVNLVNVKGWQGDLSYKFSDKLTICATGSVLTTKDDAFDIEGRTSVQQGDQVDIAGADVDQVTGFEAWLKYGLTGCTTLELGWEEDSWKPVTAVGTDDATEKYYSIGLRHAFNQNSFMRLLYQIVEYTSGDITPISGDTARGGVAIIQVNANY